MTLDKYEYHERHLNLSDSERLAWLTKNWALQINSQDVRWLCDLAAKGLNPNQESGKHDNSTPPGA